MTKKRRIRNIVWLDMEVQYAIETLRKPVESDMASNTFISRILTSFVGHPEWQKTFLVDLMEQSEIEVKLPTREVIREVSIIQCPFCWARFEDQRKLAEHLAAAHGAAASTRAEAIKE